MKIFIEIPTQWGFTLDGLIFTGFKESSGAGFDFVAITPDECDYEKSSGLGLPYNGKRGRTRDFFL